MDSITKLAMMFKDRDNPDEFGPCTAKVIAVNPLKLKMQEKIFLIANDNLIVLDTVDSKIKSNPSKIKINDSILVIPSKGTTWYAIDKVV